MAIFQKNLFESVSSGQHCTDGENTSTIIRSKWLLHFRLPRSVSPCNSAIRTQRLSSYFWTLPACFSHQQMKTHDAKTPCAFKLLGHKMTFLHLVEYVLSSQDCFPGTVYLIHCIMLRTKFVPSYFWPWLPWLK